MYDDSQIASKLNINKEIKMDSMMAFGRAEANKGQENKVFDWDKAAKIIKESGATSASAGLSGDWEWTGGDIFEDGKPVDKAKTYTYLSSNHATPELCVDGDHTDCYKMENEANGWDAHTYWPQSALDILNKT